MSSAEHSTPGEHITPGELRAADSDRDRVLDVLREAAADGRLTADEFEERATAALAARTFGDLAGLTADLGRPADLPPLTAAGSAAPRPVPADGPRLVPGYADEVMRIRQRYGSVRRTGNWPVPGTLELRTAWCEVTLDFTHALISHRLLNVRMNVRGGLVLLITPPGVVVHDDGLTVHYAHLDTGPGLAETRPAELTVRLSGRIRYGKVEVRQA